MVHIKTKRYTKITALQVLSSVNHPRFSELSYDNIYKQGSGTNSNSAMQQ